MSRTQCERVLALSKRFNGVCQADLLLPDIADGGAPITRVAARLWDLEQEGYAFEAIGTRNRCKVFRLIEDSTGRDLQVRGAGSVTRPVRDGTSDRGGIATDPPVDPPSLFKVGKAELGYADQGELDAA